MKEAPPPEADRVGVHGSGWVPVGLAVFKTVAGPASWSGVGSTPTRSRHAPRRSAYARFTVTLLRCVKLSSIPSKENSRPMPLIL